MLLFVINYIHITITKVKLKIKFIYLILNQHICYQIIENISNVNFYPKSMKSGNSLILCRLNYFCFWLLKIIMIDLMLT